MGFASRFGEKQKEGEGGRAGGGGAGVGGWDGWGRGKGQGGVGVQGRGVAGGEGGGACWVQLALVLANRPISDRGGTHSRQKSSHNRYTFVRGLVCRYVIMMIMMST